MSTVSLYQALKGADNLLEVDVEDVKTYRPAQTNVQSALKV